MAPEYALHGFLSVKTDVFSFGILVLEIVSGRKNHEGHLGAEKADILNYVRWTLSFYMRNYYAYMYVCIYAYMT